MKKTIKTLTTLLLLLALITSTTPIQPPIGDNAESNISVCGDDDEAFEDIIRVE